MAVRKGSPSKDVRAEVIARAIADPAFRRKLFQNPEEAFGAKLTRADLEGLETIKRFIPALSDMVSSLAAVIFCGVQTKG